jgi:hypothetical protein
VELVSWKKAVAMISRLDVPLASFSGLGTGARSLADLPDLIAVYGRSDGCLILCGTNISESMLDQTVRAPCLSKWLTGIYKAEIQYVDNRQFLSFTVEWRQGAPMDAAALDNVYALLVQQLGCVQPEFMDDWKNIYHAWDHDIDHRILRITPVCWPTMSNELEKSIKHRGTKG